MTVPVLFREYIWLVNTIYKARKISLSEINDKWIETDFSGGVEFSRTTFHRHKYRGYRGDLLISTLYALSVHSLAAGNMGC